MKRPRSRFLLLLMPVAGLLAACEAAVEVTPPAHEPRLVAQGFFTPDSLWAVRVTHTVPFASAAVPGFVDDALVEVWDGDRLLARPALSDSGTYLATGGIAETGRPYTLRVSAPGYPPTEGSDTLPGRVPVSGFQEALVPPADTTSRRRLAHVGVTLDDPPETADYYGLFVLQARLQEDRRTGQVTPLPPSLFTFESDDLALGEGTLGFLDTDKALYRDAFFTDGLFDGSTYTIGFDVQYDAPRPDAEVVIHRAFAVVLLSVSEDFFRYWKTAGEQALTNENPFAEPLRVHSNLTGGFGVFAGFRYRVFPLYTLSPEAAPALEPLCALVGGRLPICMAGPALHK